jgi:hypothetical protein
MTNKSKGSRLFTEAEKEAFYQLDIFKLLITPGNSLKHGFNDLHVLALENIHHKIRGCVEEMSKLLAELEIKQGTAKYVGGNDE